MSERRILNLGAGTQSSVLAIMADRGEIPPVELAIFADTQAEPREVYEHLDWLEKQLKNVPVVRVTAGNLETDAPLNRARLKRGASIPLFVLNGDGSQGIIRRQCTAEYKIEPINRHIRREVLKLGHGARVPKDVTVTQVYGISFDERDRCRAPSLKWLVFDYPLVDRKLTRSKVIDLARTWFPDHEFPRSACLFCPYRSNAEWRRLRDRSPEDWDRAVKFDHAVRAADISLVGKPFVHRQLVPLDEADIRDDDDKAGQLRFPGLMGVGANECEGMCGV